MILSNILGVSQATLRDIEKRANQLYFVYHQRLGHRMRLIEAPLPELKEIQKRILHRLLYDIRPHPIAHGFTKGRNVLTNAAVHLNSDYLLTLDIKHFFNSIPRIRVKNMLSSIFMRTHNLTYEDCCMLALLMCHNEHLPQGAPTSPTMSNIICLPLDANLRNLACRYHAQITRYADDISISFLTKHVSKKEIWDTIRFEIIHILRQYGFVSNRRKLYLRSRSQRRIVTGVIVGNKELGVKKETWKNLRAELHTKRFMSTEQKQIYESKIQWIRGLNPNRAGHLLANLIRIPVKN